MRTTVLPFSMRKSKEVSTMAKLYIELENGKRIPINEINSVDTTNSILFF